MQVLISYVTFRVLSTLYNISFNFNVQSLTLHFYKIIKNFDKKIVQLLFRSHKGENLIAALNNGLELCGKVNHAVGRT